MRVGFPEAVFFGFEIDKSGHRPTDRNLDPIIKMKPPRDKSDLRRILGLFSSVREYIKPESQISLAPLHKLVGKKSKWEWTPKHQEIVNGVRRVLLTGKHLHAVDHKYPIYMGSDASDAGEGVEVYQLVDGKKQVIGRYAKAWDREMRRRPVFY